MNILIVESAAKTRTIKNYLGAQWRVVATGGHVQTLPGDGEAHAKDAKKAFWANRPGELPSPTWVWTERGEKALKDIVEAGAEDPVFWVATDPDREGEFIAWCLERLLAPHGPTHRVSFQEITREAVQAAISNPRELDRPMVDSALVRKFLDRLVGFRTSKMAAAVAGRGSSMGRVQTPTLGFVVDRELEREAFVPTRYFEVRASAQGVKLKVRFHDKDDPAAWRDTAGKIDRERTSDTALAGRAFEAISAEGRVTVSRVQSRTSSARPPAPFSTDALLQEAGSRLGWSPKKTSALASLLYEAGHITYIRTDSTRLADSAVAAARAAVVAEFGEDHLGTGVTGNAATGPVQDAHEAIRPTHPELADVKVDGDADSSKLYRLIRARTLGSQMAPSTSASRAIEAECRGLDRPLVGSISWRTFLGWGAAYREFLPEQPTAPPDIPVAEGSVWLLDEASKDNPNPVLIEDETKPPGRYRPHTLIGAMKDAGIGRPSTYSKTAEKLEEREYVEIKDGALVPTLRGRAVWLDAAPLYAMDDGSSAELFSTSYTGEMEEGLDQIARGEADAPKRWETWRDHIRNLHEAARARRDSGGSTLSQRLLLARLIENAPSVGDHPENPASLSYEQARALIADLRTAGIEPAPSAAQLDLVRKLLEDLSLAEAEQNEVLPGGAVEALRTAGQASAAIEDLRRLFDERRPPSAKQRRFIDGLLKDSSMSEAEAAALVGVTSLQDLTGGKDGTASAMIDALALRKKAKKIPEANGAE